MHLFFRRSFVIIRSGWSELVNQRDLFFGYNAAPKAGRANNQPGRATNQPGRASHDQADRDDPQAGRDTNQSGRASHQAGRAMPGLTTEAADWLGRVRGVAGVGTECPSLGKTALPRADSQLFFILRNLKAQSTYIQSCESTRQTFSSISGPRFS
jgi:kynurenine formamidase